MNWLRHSSKVLSTRFKGLAQIEGGFVRRNIVSLYALYIANYASSLITLPYLARILGPTAFGLLATSQAYGWCIQMIVEYGFNFSGTKDAQVHRHSPQRLGSLISEIHGAKIILFSACLGVTLIIQGLIPAFRNDFRFLIASIVFGLAQGFTPVWIYQGIDRMRLYTVVDTSIRLAGTVAIFAFTRSPADAPVAMEIQALISIFSTITGLAIIWRSIPICGTTVRAVKQRFADGGSFFVYRVTFNIQMYANPLLLSFFAAPQFVAFYSGPERLAKFFLGTIGPLSEGIYPYLSRKFDESQSGGQKVAAYVLAVTSALCLIMSLCLFITAPWLIHFTLGDRFTDAIPVLRILAFLPLVSGVVNNLGIQWMIPMGLKTKYNVVTISAFVLHIGLSAYLCSRFQHIGMATSVITTQAIAACVMYILVRQKIQTMKLTAETQSADLERVESALTTGVAQ